METNVFFFFFRLPAFNPDFERLPPSIHYLRHMEEFPKVVFYRHYRVGSSSHYFGIPAGSFALFTLDLFSFSLSIYWEV